ncbi:LOW QUALITY PROTEIN: protocadherin alpha-6-like [Pomacea canaliculata]|uniref:LOW QUALITY PROTEIN: protocadherin alpha-6-like n=1 Tax=Pomacea canaliculata TaxID=400727 RepID=UPI000D72AC04|nr:LOW QUALITY PROTEIN: protocadherin alpha-6-like [Pomacea canaliculata]
MAAFDPGAAQASNCGLFMRVVLLALLVAREGTCQQLRQVVFELIESQPSGTYVGDISKASGIERQVSPAELRTLRYKFLNPNNLQTASLFSINSENSVIYTSAMIDRESICKLDEVCIISFDVTVTSTKTPFFEILNVRIKIKDINDNAPRFPTDEVTLFISEDANVKSEYKINGATDSDRGTGNSVERYDMQSDYDTFSLDVDRNLDGTWSLKIVTNSQLDRERRDHYRFLIVAKDGGTPPLSGTLTVNVNVTDANDNSPVFTQNVYDVSVQEHALVGSVVGHVLAKDRDAGQNAKITYRFSSRRASKVGDLFFIDSQSGEIKVKDRLEYESGSSFEAIVEASDRGNPPQVAQAILILRILDAGNDPPKIEINPVTDRTGSTMTLSEGAEIGLVVAHVQTTDKDQGLNGVVECRSLDESFRVERFEGRGYLVRVAKALDREAKQEHNVTVECQDSGSPPLPATSSFQIRLLDENDNNPRFEKQIYRGNLTEDNKIGEFVLRVTARDMDHGINAMLIYSISLEEQDSMFQIHHETGEITAAAVFDRETLSQVQFMVKAVDEGVPPRTGSASVIIDIVDKNDNAPYFKSSLEFEIPEKLEGGTKVGQLEAGDDDEGRNAEVQFMELTTDSRLLQVPFVVLSDGTINTDRMLIKAERETYEMIVVAKDGGNPPLNTTAMVRIRVIDSNDNPPIIEFPNRRTTLSL